MSIIYLFYPSQLYIFEYFYFFLIGQMTAAQCLNRAITLLIKVRQRVMATPFQVPKFRSHEEYIQHLNHREYFDLLDDDDDEADGESPAKWRRL